MLYANKSKFGQLYSNKERLIPLLDWVNKLLDNKHSKDAIDKLVKVDVNETFEKMDTLLKNENVQKLMTKENIDRISKIDMNTVLIQLNALTENENVKNMVSGFKNILSDKDKVNDFIKLLNFDDLKAAIQLLQSTGKAAKNVKGVFSWDAFGH